VAAALSNARNKKARNRGLFYCRGPKFFLLAEFAFCRSAFRPPPLLADFTGSG
jgi:hypothetical protein